MLRTMKITLTPQQKLQLEQVHDSTRDVLSEKLKPENGGSQSKLSATLTMHLIEHLTEHTYSHTHQIVVYV
jgi:hypothetical protein